MSTGAGLGPGTGGGAAGAAGGGGAGGAVAGAALNASGSMVFKVPTIPAARALFLRKSLRSMVTSTFAMFCLGHLARNAFRFISPIQQPLHPATQWTHSSGFR